MSMEKTTKASLFFVLLLTAFLIGTEGGRDVPKQDKVYYPQNFWGLGMGWPFFGGGWPFWHPFFGFPGGLGGAGKGLPGSGPGLGGLIPGLGGLIPGIGGGGPKGDGGIPKADHINGAQEATSP